MEFFKQTKWYFYLTAFIVAIIVFLQMTLPAVQSAFNDLKTDIDLGKAVTTVDTKLAELREKETRITEAFNTEKIIYQSQGMQVAGIASFTPLFEDIMNIAKASGIRIRSISYNYEPTSDAIFSAGIQGYNACIMDIVAVGSYTEFQNFYKNILREQYLVNFAEVSVKPWQDDKSILVTKLKLGLYTKTDVAAPAAVVPVGTAPISQ